jgi:hypothetical protein
MGSRLGEGVVGDWPTQAERATGNKEAQLKALTAFKNLHSSTPGTLRKPGAGDEITPQRLDPTASADPKP